MKNPTKIQFFFFLLVSLSLIPACKESTESGETFFNLKKIAKQNPDISSVSKGEGFDQLVLNVTPSSENATVTIWKTGDNGNWTEAKYLVFEIWDAEDYSGVINIEFYKKSESSNPEKVILQSGEVATDTKETPWLSCLMGVLPRLKTKVVLPLSYLDAQSLFVTRSPRQLKGTMSGDRLDPIDIKKVALRFGPFAEPWFIPQFEVGSISLTDTLPEPYQPCEVPVIDIFGQRNDKDWSGKIKDEDDLIRQNLELEKMVTGNSFPSEWSRYGGLREKRFKATGFFRTQHDGERWWLVDPEGYAFLSVGVDCIRLTSSGPVNGIEDLFEWLPGEDDSYFSDVLSLNRNAKNMDFYRSNLIRIFGDSWKEKWSLVTAGLMREFRVNTVGNWSDIAFARGNRIPYVLPLNRFPTTRVQLYRDFPDVFSEEYLKNSEEFAKQLNDYKDDPFLVGYFLRNEPQWAFGYHNLAYEMFGTNQASVTKNEFINWIDEKYNGDIEQLNKAWAQNLKDFESLKQMTFKDYPSVRADSDFYAFSTIMVKRYVDIPCDEVSKIDKNHLNLGMRYAWISSDLLYKAGERFDVFSINGYGYNPPATAEISKISGKPVMIGEFHHGAVDRALPATGITGVLNQEQRAAAYRNYIEQGFARPELVGMHYFQWVDQPFYGRFDGENYNIGVVTLNNIPYQELTEAMKITNERIYKVGTGEKKPYKAEITKIPSIHY
ncbi:MAG: hypothetical protein MUO72_13175 [Bacteroidales bacterium]|nr:hypothetical protein [Bacteroidales bacterium]